MSGSYLFTRYMICKYSSSFESWSFQSVECRQMSFFLNFGVNYFFYHLFYCLKLFVRIICLRVGMCMGMQGPSESRSLEVTVSSCEPPCMAAGNRRLILYKSSVCS